MEMIPPPAPSVHPTIALYMHALSMHALRVHDIIMSACMVVVCLYTTWSPVSERMDADPSSLFDINVAPIETRL